METIQARLSRGDPAAFAELYDSYSDRLGHYLLLCLGSRDDASDALQETFLRLARNRDGLANVANIEAYVFAIARNEANRMASRLARRKREWQPPAVEELFQYGADETERRDTAEMVAAALARLSPDQREIVELKIYGELTFQQISQVTGTPQGTVASRYRSALAKMQEWFARQPK